MHRKFVLFSVFILISVAFSDVLKATELKAFTSDGCSAFPDGTIKQKQLWLSCCYQHDVSYWKGGTFDERKSADLALKECVADVGEPTIAALMLAGVRVGGTPYLPTSFRWGYGWPYLRTYKPLSQAEHEQVKQSLKQYESHWQSMGHDK